MSLNPSRNMTAISSVREFLGQLEKYNSDATPPTLFRGQSTDEPLCPRLGRLKLKRDLLTAERDMFLEFKRQAAPFADLGRVNDWDWLALAQHHSLATRLLDWTLNPLAALWFAIHLPPEEDRARKATRDGVLWIFPTKQDDWVRDDIILKGKPSPFDVPRTGVFRPRHIARRITAQAGCFTVHPITDRGFVALERNKRYKKRLIKLSIPAENFWSIRSDLDRCGFNNATMFPDLDGLSRNIQWEHSLLADEID